jgi:plasmid stabilization system protein ParE
MPRGSKASYSPKQKRKAEHIEEGYEDRGLSRKEAERRAWATVNKQDGGARRKSRSTSKSRKSSKSTGRKKSIQTRRRSTKTRGRSANSRSRAGRASQRKAA